MNSQAMNNTNTRAGKTSKPPTTPPMSHGEVLPDVEALVRGWQALLVNRTRPYALQQEDGTYRWVFRPLDTRALRAHLRIGEEQLHAAAVRRGIPTDAGGQSRGLRRRVDGHVVARAAAGKLRDPAIAAVTVPSTTSAVIRWVDARISPLDLLDELCPQSEMRVAGQGFVGWCPFHDDRAPDERGKPGTPSFYVVYNRRYGWSWRCLSTNCAYSEGPMKHNFRLLQDLLGLDVRAAIGAACARWGGEPGSLEHTGGVDEDREDGVSDE